LCALFLGRGPFPSGKLLTGAGNTVAVATDCNPGSAMGDDLWLAATVAATRCGLTLPQALLAITAHAAAAVGEAGTRGVVAPGATADLVILDTDDWREQLYQLGAPDPWKVMAGGHVVCDEAAAGSTGTGACRVVPSSSL
jgi:imidazolonepropionase